MGKKKFVDKKKSATFTLVFRDTAAADGDAAVPVRQFTRIDGGDSYVPGFTEDDPRLQPGGDEEEDGEDYEEEEEESVNGGEEEEDSRFDDADASEDDGEKRVAAQAKGKGPKATVGMTGVRRGLAENVRRDLIELGFPDDGYDYNQHMRIIASTGPGAAFVPSTRAADPLHADIRAYDASKVDVQPVSKVEEAAASEVIEHVSSSTRPVRKPLSKDGVLDVDIIAALENSDGSQFDSADELEDEFVIVASVADDEGPAPHPHENATTSSGRREEGRSQKQRHDVESDTEEPDDNDEGKDELGDLPGQPHRERPIRLLDEQFETLALNEYDDYDDGELDDDDPFARGPGDISQFSSILSEFLTDKDTSEKYETIAESHRDGHARRSRDTNNAGWKTANTDMVVNVGVEEIVLKKTLELGERLSEGEEMVLVAVESDDDKDSWDCESVVSVVSNLDNLPGKISVPEKSKVRRPKLQDVEKAGIIRLGGKQHLPVDYLPGRGDEDKKGEKPVFKETQLSSAKVGGPRAGETPAEKKARKALVKENKRDARVARKTLRLCYKDESQKAQQAAATMGPKVFHLP